MTEIKTLEPELSAHPFFSGLESRYLGLLVGCAKNARYDSGKYLFHRDEEAADFFLVRGGKVNLEIFVPGQGPLILQTLGEGDIIGWSWLIPPFRWRFDARAMELVRVVTLDGKCLREKCEKDHDLGYELLKRFSEIIVDRLEMTRLQIIDCYKNQGELPGKTIGKSDHGR